MRDSVKSLWLAVGRRLPVARAIIATARTTAPITWRTLMMQRLFRFNGAAYWPMHFTSVVTHPRKIQVGIGTAPGLSRGCYIQAANGLQIGDYTVIGPNVGLISSNHNPYQHGEHLPAAPISIGSYCLLGSGAVVLPGVKLGDHTVVAAGAVVNRSAPEGCCVLAGAPARVVERLDPLKIRRYRGECEYVGYHRLGDCSKADLWRKLRVANF